MSNKGGAGHTAVRPQRPRSRLRPPRASAHGERDRRPPGRRPGHHQRRARRYPADPPVPRPRRRDSPRDRIIGGSATPLLQLWGHRRRRLWSRFRAHIGISPEHASELVRFVRTAHLLAAGRSPRGCRRRGRLRRPVPSAPSNQGDHRDDPTVVARAPWPAIDGVAWPTTRSPRPDDYRRSTRRERADE